MGKLRLSKGKRWGTIGTRIKSKQRRINKMEVRLTRLGRRRKSKLIGSV